MVNVLICDDNKAFCLALVNYVLKFNKNLRIADIVTNGKDAINSINELRPEIILLDIKMPYCSGLEVLSYIKNIDEYEPRIIFISGDIGGIAELNNSKEKYLLIEKGTSFDNILRVISNIEREIESSRINKYVDDFLKKINFNITSIGFKYLKKAILLAYEEPCLLDNMENNLYEKIASVYNVSNKKIKWNIQKLINSMWRYSVEEQICDIFEIKDKRKPTAKLIIEKVCSNIKEYI